MTCIVGLVKNGRVYMGGDSAFVSDWDMTILPNQKVFIRSGAVFGVAGNPRALNLLRYHMQIPPTQEADLLSYMATSFLDAMRECFKSNGYAVKDNEFEYIGSNILVGCAGKLFSYDSNYYVSEVSDYTAIGSGAVAALGAMYATPKVSPAKRVQIALEAAERLSIGVRGPFQIVSIR